MADNQIFQWLLQQARTTLGEESADPGPAPPAESERAGLRRLLGGLDDRIDPAWSPERHVVGARDIPVALKFAAVEILLDCAETSFRERWEPGRREWLVELAGVGVAHGRTLDAPENPGRGEAGAERLARIRELQAGDGDIVVRELFGGAPTVQRIVPTGHALHPGGPDRVIEYFGWTPHASGPGGVVERLEPEAHRVTARPVGPGLAQAGPYDRLECDRRDLLATVRAHSASAPEPAVRPEAEPRGDAVRVPQGVW